MLNNVVEIYYIISAKYSRNMAVKEENQLVSKRVDYLYEGSDHIMRIKLGRHSVWLK